MGGSGGTGGTAWGEDAPPSAAERRLATEALLNSNTWLAFFLSDVRLDIVRSLGGAGSSAGRSIGEESGSGSSAPCSTTVSCAIFVWSGVVSGEENAVLSESCAERRTIDAVRIGGERSAERRYVGGPGELVTIASFGRPFCARRPYAGLSGVVGFPFLDVCESFLPRHHGINGFLSRRVGLRIASSVGRWDSVPNVSPLRTVSEALATDPDRVRVPPPGEAFSVD